MLHHNGGGQVHTLPSLPSHTQPSVSVSVSLALIGAVASVRTPCMKEPFSWHGDKPGPDAGFDLLTTHRHRRKSLTITLDRSQCSQLAEGLGSEWGATNSANE